MPGRGDDIATNKRRKVRHYQYKLLLAVKKGQYPSQIARQLNIPRTTVNSRIRRLIAIGFVKVDLRSSCTFYRLTATGYKAMKTYGDDISRYLREQGKTRLHRLNIKFEILEDKGLRKFDREYPLNNWIQRFTTIKYPVGITLKKTTKSVVAMFHEFESARVGCLTDFFSHVLKGIYYTYYYCMNRHGITLNIHDFEITDQHLVNERPDLEGKVDDKQTTTLMLRRKARSIAPTGINAKAWLDRSHGIPEIESNDFLYQERLLMMPETVDRMAGELTPAIRELRTEINLHLQVQREMLETLREIRGSLKRRK